MVSWLFERVLRFSIMVDWVLDSSKLELVDDSSSLFMSMGSIVVHPSFPLFLLCFEQRRFSS